MKSFQTRRILVLGVSAQQAVNQVTRVTTLQGLFVTWLVRLFERPIRIAICLYDYNAQTEYYTLLIFADTRFPPMSLPIAYSSDEEDNLESVQNDAFGLSSLPVAKRARVDEEQTIATDAAPHVLAEVISHLNCNIIIS